MPKPIEDDIPFEHETEAGIVVNNKMLEAILHMPEWDIKEPKCFLTLKRKISGEDKLFVVEVSATERVALDEKESAKRYVPEPTQPSWGFDELVVDELTFYEVFESLTSVYREFLFFMDEFFHNIQTLAAMSTYFREVFFAYPYIDYQALEYNCGKTTALQALIWSSYQGLVVVDPSPSSMFRAIDYCNSTIGIDEIDNLLEQKDVARQFTGLLNAGYKKGIEAIRVDMNQGGKVVSYDAFGMKSYTHTDKIGSSFESRGIVVSMLRSPKKLPNLASAEIFREPRDKMYALRLQYMDVVAEKFKWVKDNSELTNRNFEKFSAILTMAKVISDELYETVNTWCHEYVSDWKDEQVDDNRRILVEVLMGLNGTVKLVDIVELFNTRLMDLGVIELNKFGDRKWEFHSKTVKSMLKVMGLKRSPLKTGNYVHYIIDSERVGMWANTYGLTEDTGPQGLELYDESRLEKIDSVEIPEVKKIETKKIDPLSVKDTLLLMTAKVKGKKPMHKAFTTTDIFFELMDEERIAEAVDEDGNRIPLHYVVTKNGEEYLSAVSAYSRDKASSADVKKVLGRATITERKKL